MDKNDDASREIIEKCRIRNNVWLLTVLFDFSFAGALLSAFALFVRAIAFCLSSYSSSDAIGMLIFDALLLFMMSSLTLILFVFWIKHFKKCTPKLATFIISFTISIIIIPISILLLYWLLLSHYLSI